MKASSEWGVPDWRNADAYPSQQTTREWWWEFTRRRPDFRRLWKEAPAMEGKEYRYAPDVDDCRLEFQLSVLLDPRVRFDDWALMHHRFRATGPRRAHWHLDGLREMLTAPWGRDRIYEAIERDHRLTKMEEEAGLHSITFYLKEPLKPQLARAGDYLNVVQAELYGRQNTQRPREDRFPQFLRALDARDAGATYAQMRAVFWPDEEYSADDLKDETHARELVRSAVRVRDNFPI